MTWSDPIVDEIRRIREEHAASFNYDLRAIFEDLVERQRLSGLTYYSILPDGTKVVTIPGTKGEPSEPVSATPDHGTTEQASQTAAS